MQSKIHIFENSWIIRLLAKTEIWFAIVLAIAPIASTMVCAAVAGMAIFSLFVRKVIFGTNPSVTQHLPSVSVGRHLPLAGEARRGAPTLTWFVLAFLILTFIYSLTSLDIIGSLKIWSIYALFISMFFIAREVIKTKKDWSLACWVLASVGGLVASYGVFQNFFGTNLGHAWLDEEMFTGISVRVYSTLGNPNVLGEYLLLTIPVTVGLLWNKITNYKLQITNVGRFATQIIFLLGLVGMQLLCMIYTQSRGCWVALAFSALIFILFVDKRWMLLLIVGLIAAPFILPQSMMDRLLSIGNMGDSSTSYRVNIWMGTLNMLEHFWLTGVGLGAAAFAKVYPFYSYSMITAPHAHNIYLQTLSEMGVVGLALLVLIISSFVFGVVRFYVKQTPPPLRGTSPSQGRHLRASPQVVMAVAFMAGMLGFMLQGAFDYVWYNYRVFLMFWLFLGIGSKIAEQQKE